MDVGAKDAPSQTASSTTREVAVYSYRWVILLVCWLAYLSVYLQRLTVGPLAPLIKEDLAITSTQLGAFISASAFGYMLVLLPAGAIVDRIGVRWILFTGQLAGGVLIMGMTLVHSFNGGMLVMATTGLGTGLIMPATTKAVLVWFPARERATAMGLKQTAVNAGGIVTAATLPALAVAWGWRYGFVAVGTVAIVMSILSFVLYREPAGQAKPLAAQSLVRGVARIMKGRDIWLVTLAGAAFMAVEFAATTYMVLYFKEGLAMSVVTAGGLLAVAQAGGAFGKPFSGLLSDRILGGKRKFAYALMGTISAICMAAISVLSGGNAWLLGLVSFGIGLAAIGWGGLHLTMVSEIAGRELAATVAAISSFFLMIGNIIGPPLFGYIVDRWDSYRLGWEVLAVGSIISAVAVMFVREGRKGL